jgi:hypothetical protein
MIDWMTGLLLSAAGAVVALFLARDNTNFGVFQMMVATLFIAAGIGLLVFGPVLWRAVRGGPPPDES